jgi:hypothetical protein
VLAKVSRDCTPLRAGVLAQADFAEQIVLSWLNFEGSG